MNPTSITHSMQHWYLEIALKRHGELLATLDKEMSNFIPKPNDQFSEFRQKTLEQFRQANPLATEEELGTAADTEVEIHADRRIQFHSAFSDRFMLEAIPIVFLAHGLIEATINATLAIGFHNSGKTGLFEVFEKQELKRKLELGPQIFIADYSLSKGNSLWDRLSRLIKIRNAWAHSKIHLTADNVRVTVGSNENQISYDEEGRKIIRSFIGLPYDLHNNLCSQVADPQVQFRLQGLLRSK